MTGLLHRLKRIPREYRGFHQSEIRYLLIQWQLAQASATEEMRRG